MRLLSAAGLLLISTTWAMAQSSHGYAFVAPGAATAGGSSQTTVQAGGGFEALVYRRIVGAGAEVSYLTTTRDWSSGFGVASPNGYVHFPMNRLSNLDPYFTAGYSLFFKYGTANAFNYGGGLNWWVGERVGLKFEIRDQYGDSIHYWGMRFGVTFR